MSARSMQDLHRVLIWLGSLAVVICTVSAVAVHEGWLLGVAALGFGVQHVGWSLHRRWIGGAA
ncbi:hypothetical protein [Streptomyces sp. NPDC005533]|uniref:hypothetical protein n=1 Tax=Streptomyces sp. NPDC005533 TaxID=3364723 RepID=UPI003699558F